MFREEALWVGNVLEKLGNIPEKIIANIGSSTSIFRKQIQPHIQEYIFSPLEKSGWQVIHIDIKNEDGVDLVADITDKHFGDTYANRFPVVLCTNMLEHVEDIPLVVSNLYKVCQNNGYLVITVPYKYKKHLDPIDNMFRPTPAEIEALFSPATVIRKNGSVITIRDKAYYRMQKSSFPLWGYRNRIAYYLGFKHKVSGLVLQVIK